MVPAIIDIEASGFGNGSYPIEIGLALPDGTTHCFIIRPDTSWTHWDNAAQAVHGIPRETLVESGKPVTEVAEALNRLVGGKKIYTDAWSYDLCWLGKLFDVAGLPQLFQLESIRALMNETQAERWHATKSRVIRKLGLARHRASTDALILQHTYIQSEMPS
jgi:hypothetical protein